MFDEVSKVYSLDKSQYERGSKGCLVNESSVSINFQSGLARVQTGREKGMDRSENRSENTKI